MERPLEGQVAIVTGAGRFIGRAHALAFAEAGAKVLVNDLTEGGDETVAMIKQMGGEAVAFRESISSWAGGKAVVEAAMDAFGRIDILINNAGINRARSIHEMSEEEWDDVVNVSLKGYAATIRHAAPYFMAQRSGAIVNTGSTSGQGHIMMANYSAAKEGTCGLTRTVARDLGPYGVRCNMIRPMSLNTGQGNEGVRESNRRSTEYGYFTSGPRYLILFPDSVKPDCQHVAAMAVFLCLPETAHISGQDFYIQGDTVGRFSEPQLIGAQFMPGGWTLDGLLRPDVMDNLIGDIRNRYLIPLKAPVNAG
jgi:3-oxoacyl-[acyl-carrier protein] reductase